MDILLIEPLAVKHTSAKEMLIDTLGREMEGFRISVSFGEELGLSTPTFY